MPKKYGITKLEGRVIRCSKCGYSWAPSSSELSDISNGLTVSCLMCRAMDELKPGQLLPKNIDYKLVEVITDKNPDNLRDDSFRDKDIKVIHK